jgi:hypothetical protein
MLIPFIWIFGMHVDHIIYDNWFYLLVMLDNLNAFFFILIIWTIQLYYVFLQYFLEQMKVPRVESKLRVFSFKIQFGSQVWADVHF